MKGGSSLSSTVDTSNRIIDPPLKKDVSFLRPSGLNLDKTKEVIDLEVIEEKETEVLNEKTTDENSILEDILQSEDEVITVKHILSASNQHFADTSSSIVFAELHEEDTLIEEVTDSIETEVMDKLHDEILQDNLAAYFDIYRREDVINSRVKFITEEVNTNYYGELSQQELISSTIVSFVKEIDTFLKEKKDEYKLGRKLNEIGVYYEQFKNNDSERKELWVSQRKHKHIQYYSDIPTQEIQFDNSIYTSQRARLNINDIYYITLPTGATYPTFDSEGLKEQYKESRKHTNIAYYSTLPTKEIKKVDYKELREGVNLSYYNGIPKLSEVVENLSQSYAINAISSISTEDKYAIPEQKYEEPIQKSQEPPVKTQIYANNDNSSIEPVIPSISPIAEEPKQEKVLTEQTKEEPIVDEGVFYEKGMSVWDFVKANKDHNTESDVLKHFSVAEIQVAISHGQIFKRRGKFYA